MYRQVPLDNIAINTKCHMLLKELLQENPILADLLLGARNETEALVGVRKWVMKEMMRTSPEALEYYAGETSGREAFDGLKWSDFAGIRILDYCDNAGREFTDLNLRGDIAYSNPIRLLWLAATQGTGGAKPAFFEDMLQLFRQLSGKNQIKMPSRKLVEKWMKRYPSGLDPRVVKLREENRERIIEVLIDRMNAGEIRSQRFKFYPGMSREQKFLQVLRWWENDYRFHLRFAVRLPEVLNEMLGNSLDPDTLKVLDKAEKAGIPFFINPYYLSLLNVRTPDFAVGADQAIRQYVVYSDELVGEFGHIVAWEREDEVQPGKPNAAGWLLPNQHNIHRRYPDVAILIPDTAGRACGGLCSSCQRMYDFQSGHLSFNLDKLKAKESWPKKLGKLMKYFENDSQLRDILVTGGDALMTGNKSLKRILDAILKMTMRKREANQARKDKHAEMQRVRLGSRLPVYLPQRIDDELTGILADFKAKASEAGIKQFVIQTHFVSPMEVTPEAREGIRRLISAGWTVTNQQVFNVASARRGHTAKLRQTLNEVGVLPYYTFSVKGYMENYASFATNARAVQEQREEKVFGEVSEQYRDKLREFPHDAERMVQNIAALRKEGGLPFLATDRNVLNLPGVGKSLTFRVIGITRYGRRILSYQHDATRSHSPIIEKMPEMIVIESKSTSDFLRQMWDLGEDVNEYESLWGYSLGETEPRMPVYEYPGYDFDVTDEITNLDLGPEDEEEVEIRRTA